MTRGRTPPIQADASRPGGRSRASPTIDVVGPGIDLQDRRPASVLVPDEIDADEALRSPGRDSTAATRGRSSTAAIAGMPPAAIGEAAVINDRSSARRSPISQARPSAVDQEAGAHRPGRSRRAAGSRSAICRAQSGRSDRRLSTKKVSIVPAPSMRLEDGRIIRVGRQPTRGRLPEQAECRSPARPGGRRGPTCRRPAPTASGDEPRSRHPHRRADASAPAGCRWSRGR